FVPDESACQILVVDDSPMIAMMLEQTLLTDGHRVTVACDGHEALARIAEAIPDLILLDLEMPRLNGYEVCRHVKQDPATRLVPVVIITGQSAAEARLHAWELGADDFLTKPFQCVDILARCRSLLRVKRLVDELDSAAEVVFALARAVEAKSPYTQGHAERVTALALELAAEIGVSGIDCEAIRRGALLHDIGKISIPDCILDKPTSLTPEEYAIIKTHPVQGVHIVEPLRSIRDAVPLIRWHHERLDGRGYPDGLSGEQIPLNVRILSVADTFDALASARPYRAPVPPDRCLEYLRVNAAGGGLDPGLVKAFCLLRGRDGDLGALETPTTAIALATALYGTPPVPRPDPDGLTEAVLLHEVT